MNTKRILAELRAERTRIDRAIAALQSLDSASGRSTRGTTRRGRRRMSAAARKRIGAAKKAWWAARKKE